MKNWITILSFVFAFLVRMDAQQQPLYTQFMYNKLALNPAFAGHDDLMHFNFLYRNQWIGLDGAPTAQQLSFNMPFKQQKIGIGMNLTRHSIGVTEMITLDGIYAYKFRVQTGILSLGTQISSRSLTVDYSDPRILAIDEIGRDPAISNTEERKHVFNIGFGAYYHTDRYFAGISFPRIMNASIDFDAALDESRESQHALLMLGGKFTLSETTDIMPQVLLRWASNSPVTADINTSLIFYDKYTAGLTIRTGGESGSIAESLDFIFAMNIQKNLMIGFGYDVTLSKLRKYQSGSVEILVHYNLEMHEKTSEFVNPRFF